VSHPTLQTFSLLVEAITLLIITIFLCPPATQAHDGDIAYNPIPSSASRQKRGATAIRERLWPNARIPYEISPIFDSKCLYIQYNYITDKS
jgi:hypothetical protein